jgi:hypothetical protein
MHDYLRRAKPTLRSPHAPPRPNGVCLFWVGSLVAVTTAIDDQCSEEKPSQRRYNTGWRWTFGKAVGIDEATTNVAYAVKRVANRGRQLAAIWHCLMVAGRELLAVTCASSTQRGPSETLDYAAGVRASAADRCYQIVAPARARRKSSPQAVGLGA